MANWINASLMNYDIIPYSTFSMNLNVWFEAMMCVCVSLSHWIFSIEYLKVSLRFPIMIDLFQKNANQKIMRNN